MLSSDSESPEVSETSVTFNFLESLEVFSQLGVDLVGNQLGGSAFSGVRLSVQEPLWDSPLGWVRNDFIDLFDFSLSQFSGSLVEVDLSQLQDQVGEPLADSLDGGEGEHNLVFTFDVGVLDSENMGEVSVWDDG